MKRAVEYLIYPFALLAYGFGSFVWFLLEVHSGMVDFLEAVCDWVDD